MKETKQQGVIPTEKKSILKIIFGDLPFKELLKINAKLKTFDKIINIFWYVFFIASIIIFLIIDVSESEFIYLVITTPLIILIYLSLIILFRRDFGVQRFICIGCTAIMMVLSYQWIDLYSFIKKDYIVIEGVPSKVEKVETKYQTYWEVVINDVKFSLPLKYKRKQIKSGLVIQYLPYSKFIIEYKIKYIK